MPNGQAEALAVLQEVHILASLEHPFIIRYYDSFVDERKLFLVMEYASNGSLHTVLQQHQKMQTPIEEIVVWQYVLQLLLGLHAIHSRRVLHRDIKARFLMLKVRSWNSPPIPLLRGRTRPHVSGPESCLLLNVAHCTSRNSALPVESFLHHRLASARSLIISSLELEMLSRSVTLVSLAYSVAVQTSRLPWCPSPLLPGTPSRSAQPHYPSVSRYATTRSNT